MERISDNFRVLIIGAGAVGLLVAQGLKKTGINYVVYEREGAEQYNVRPRDWSMAYHWGRKRMTELLPQHMLRDLWQIDTDPYSWTYSDKAQLHNVPEPPAGYPFKICGRQETDFAVQDMADGEIMTWVNAETSNRCSRRKLREFLRRDVKIEYGKSFKHLSTTSNSVTAFFEDGTSATGSILVGCDASNSDVRAEIVPGDESKLELMPIRLYNFNQRFTHEQALFMRKAVPHPNFWYGIHGPTNSLSTTSVLDTPDPNDGSTWLFQIGWDTWEEPMQPHLETSEQRLNHLKSLSDQFCEPWRSALKWVKDDTYISPDRVTHMPTLPEWDMKDGRATLAGDSAHPMCPYRGQGFNNGVEDATMFVRAVNKIVSGSQSQRDAIREYTQEVRARGQEETRVSAEQGYAAHHIEAFMTSPVMTRGFNR